MSEVNLHKVNREIISPEPSSVVQLFELDLSQSNLNIGNLRFHPGEIDKFEDKFLVWQGKEYRPLACVIEGIDLKGDGRLPRPKLLLSNYQGAISRYLKALKDITGYKVTRRRTFLRFLDGVNFDNNQNPYGEPDPDAHFLDDIFYVNHKISESKNLVEFELVSVLEMENVGIPARQVMANYCTWTYRSTIGCGYQGRCAGTKKDKPLTGGLSSGPAEKWVKGKVYRQGDEVFLSPNDTTDPSKPNVFYKSKLNGNTADPRISPLNWDEDACSKSLHGCRLRYGPSKPGEKSDGSLPFGGFPATNKFNHL